MEVTIFRTSFLKEQYRSIFLLYTIGALVVCLFSSFTKTPNSKIVETSSVEVNSMPTYCNSSGSNVNYEYILNVSLESINNTSNAQGYTDFTAISTDLKGGNIYSISVTPGFVSSPYNEGYAIWIDYNQDGDFLDADEQILTVSPTPASLVSGVFQVPKTALTGNTRMRVSLKYGSIPTSCENFTYGEVEDYTVNIVAADPVNCDIECSSPYTFDWYDGTNGAQWSITNGESTVENVYTISGSQGNYNVSVTLDNQDGQNLDFANCGATVNRAYTATCQDPNGNTDCDGDSNTNDSQFSYGCGYLTLGSTSQNSSQTTSITYSFDFPTYICDIEISDIDYLGGSNPALSSYQDEVDITADSLGVPVLINAVSGPAVDIYNNGTSNVKLLADYSDPNGGELAGDDLSGIAYISTETRVTSITITYSNGPDDDGQSDDHSIRIGSFDFCPVEKYEICDNGVDDDENGLVDCEDGACSGEDYCQGPCIPEKLFVERWFGISGSSVTDLTSNANYPNSPDELDYITIFQGPSNYSGNYGTRVRGYIIPSETGTYSFNVTGDDNTILYLSSDVNETNKTEIASVTGWSNISEHTKYTTQTSIDIILQANVWYYVELLHKEGGGADHFQVYWRTPSVPSTWTLIPGQNLAPYLCPEICDNGDDDDNDGFTDCDDPDCGNGININITSADTILCDGEFATLNAEFSGSPGLLSYAWSNGETTSSISVNPSITTAYMVTATNSSGCEVSDQIQVVVNSLPNSTISDNGPINCSQSTVDLIASPGGMTYQWQGGGTNQTKTISATGTYAVTITDSNGCSNIASATVAEDFQPPIVDAGWDKETCAGDDVMLSVYSDGNVEWSNGLGSSSTVIVSPNTDATYFVTATGVNGCIADDTVSVIILDAPGAGLLSGNEENCGEFDPSEIISLVDPSGSDCNDIVITGNNSCDFGDDPVLLSFTYNGEHCLASNNSQGAINGDWDCDGNGPNSDPTVYISVNNNQFAGNVALNESFNVYNGGSILTSPINVSIYDSMGGDLVQSIEITTSCSQPLIIGDQFGSLVLREVEFDNGYTENGGPEGIYIQWQQRVLGGSWEDISGANNTTYDPDFIQKTTQFRRVTTNCCGSDISSIITKTVHPLIYGYTSPDVTICDGDTTVLDSYVGLDSIHGGFLLAGYPELNTNNFVRFEDTGAAIPRLEIYINNNTSPTVIYANQIGRIESNNTDHNHTDPRVGYNGEHERTLLDFDLSSISGEVTWANLVLVAEDSGPLDIGLYAISNSWNEAEVSWEESENGILWDNPGVLSNIDPVYDVQTVNEIGDISWEVTSLVESWVNGESNTAGTYSYSWSNGMVGKSITVSPNTSTNYYVTITNPATNCSTIDSVLVTVNPLPTVSLTNDGPFTCDKGSVTMTALPAGMNYLWGDGSNLQNRIVSSSGTYYVTVTDGNGCENIASTTVNEDFTPPKSEAGPNVEICLGDSTTLTGSGGVSYEWSHSVGNTSSVTVSPASTTTYTLTVTGANGCTSTDTVRVEVYDLPAVSVSNNGPLTCSVNNVVMTALPAGNAYLWEDGGTNQTNTVSFPGIYNVTVTDINGCSSVGNTEVLQDITPPIANAGLDQTICEGDTITLTASGGVAYSWSGGLGTSSTVSVSPSATTTYTVTVTATNGCIDTDEVVVTVNSSPNVICQYEINGTGVVTGDCEVEVCVGDRLVLTADPNYMDSYVWSGPNGFYGLGNNLGRILVSDSIGLDAAGDYTVVVTNSNGCSSAKIMTVVVNPLPAPVITNNGPITCSLPVVTMNVEPAGLSYLWYDGGTNQSNTTNTPGIYGVIVTDSNGCSNSTRNIVTIDTIPPIAEAGPNQSICFGESTILTASGGVLYEWDNGGGSSSTTTVTPNSTTIYTVTVTALNGCTDIDSVTVNVNPNPVVLNQYEINSEGVVTGLDSLEICLGDTLHLGIDLNNMVSYEWSGPNGFSGLGNTFGRILVSNDMTIADAGLYSVTVTDGNGCTSTSSVSVAVNLLPPALASNDGPIICSTPTIMVSAEPVGMDYLWEDGSTNISLLVDTPGNYFVTVTDSNGCSNIASSSVTIDTIPPVAEAGLNQEICIGDSTILTASGALSYEWNGGLGSTPSIEVSPIVNTTYTVTVTDNKGCTDTDDVTVIVNSLPVPVATNNGPLTCAVPVVTLTAEPAGMNYEWQGGSTQQTHDISTIGIYSVTVTDLNGCSASTTTEVTEDFSVPTAVASNDEVICEGTDVTLSATGGVNYVWSHGLGSGSSVIASPLVSTTFTVTAFGSNGCSDSDEVYVEVLPKPEVSILDSDTICVQTTTSLSPGFGGTWISSDNTTAIVSSSGVVFGLNPGSVNFTFTSGTNGCASDPTDDVVITEDLSCTISKIGGDCLNENSQLVADVIGGTENFQYNWSGPNGFSGNTAIVDVIESGNYYLTVSDVAGCSDVTSAFIYEAFEPLVFTLNTEICEDEEITISVNSPSAIAYQWSANTGNLTTQSIQVTPGLPNEDYFVTVTSNVGCTSEGSIHIDVIPKTQVLISGNEAICIGETTTLLPDAGGSWTSSDSEIAGVSNSGIVTGLSPGSVTFSFYDSLTNCISNPTQIVTIHDNPFLSILGPNQICEGEITNLSPSSGGIWESSDTTIATVSSNGTVVGISEGVVDFTYTDTNTGCESDSTLTIIVNEIIETAFIGPNEVCVGENTYLSPSSGGTWESSDEMIATITNGGVVTTLSPGIVSFTFISSDLCNSGPTGDLMVNANEVVTIDGVSQICEDEVWLFTSSSVNGTWTSSNSSIITVDSMGEVTGIAPGLATISYIHNGTACELDASFEVEVQNKPTVVLNGPSQICVDEISSVTTSDTGGIWLSSDETIAIVSSEGTIIGQSAGIVTFRYLSISGCLSDETYPLTVNPAVDVNIEFLGSICLEDNSQLTSIVTGGTSAINYSWSGPGGFTSSQDTIDATLPGLYTLVVTDSVGCSSSAEAYLNEEFDPFIFSLSTDICEGESISLSVNGSSGGSYVWSSNAGSSTSQSVNVFPSAPSETYFVTVTNSIGCTVVTSAEINVSPLPAINLLGDDQICVGQTSSLSPDNGGLWTSNNYTVASVTNAGIITGLSPGVVNFTFRDTSSGCYSEESMPVTILENENIIINGSNSICLGTLESYTISINGGQWISSDPGVATIDSTGNVIPVSVGTTNISYEPPANTCYSIPVKSVTIYDTPVVSLTGPSTICEGGNTFLYPTNTGTWVSDDVSVATVSDIGIVTGVSGGVATFTFTSTAGCVQTLSTPITVIANPTVNLTGPSSICVNEITTLSPATGGFWQSSNNLIASVSSSGEVIGNSEGIAEFTFTEFINGCVASEAIEITVDPIPTITEISNSTICAGDTTSISSLSNGYWISSDPSVAVINTQGVITGISGGGVTFTFIDSLTGCNSNESDILIVNSVPEISVTGDTDLCTGDISSIIPNSGGVWSSSNELVASITNMGEITALGEGTVSFTFTNSNGCVSDESEVFVVTNPITASISGPSNICTGEIDTLMGSTNGSYVSSNESILSVSNSGVITSISPGTAQITLITPSNCISNPTIEITVDPSPNPTITGPSSICIGASTTLSPSSGGQWTSSDSAIAIVDGLGMVTGISGGLVNFTFTDSSTGCSASTSSPLTVFNEPIINILGNDEICVGETTSMSPSTGGQWISSDNSVATIDPSGLVTAVSQGMVTFTFIENSTSCSSSSSDIVTIFPKPVVSITGATELCVGSTSTLFPTTGGTWISSNEAVATVSDQGIVTAIGQGVANFTFVSEVGCSSDQTTPIVVNAIPTVFIDGTSELCLGETVNMQPSSGGVWVSNDESIAVIDSTGLVTSLSGGTVTFTFTDSSTGCVSMPSDYLTVNSIPGTGLNGPDSICIGSTTNFTPTVGGVWESLNPSVASIANNGEVVGISSGNSTFLFTQLSSGCTSDTTVSINVSTESSPVFTGPEEICSGDTTYLSPTTGVTWESTNLGVATISNEGVIIGVGQGTSKFRFTNNATGCISEYSSSLIVNGQPTTFVVGDNLICVGTTTTLSPNTGGTWTSLNTDVATVSTDGIVSGVSEGTAYFIFIDSLSGCQSDGSLSVEVEDVVPVTIAGEQNVCIGYTIQLTPNSGGVWASSNEDIATISNSGIVTGKAPGKVSFTFTDLANNCVNDISSDSITVLSCKNHDFNVAVVNQEIFGNISTNDNYPTTPTYSSSPQLISKPAGSIVTFNINSDGSYSFQGSEPGNYRYNVPVCLDPVYNGCPTSLIEITLVENQYSTGNPVTNLDIATMYGVEGVNKGATVPGTVGINTNQNDVCIYTQGCDMDWNTAWLETQASNGLSEIKSDGIIEYTPNSGFIGFDTIYYGMCADGYSNCNTSMQIITVNHPTAANTVVAADDFIWTLRGNSISGNVLNNDSDAEGDLISVTPQGSLMAPIVTSAGEYFIDALGDFNFTPNESFSGHTEIIYEVCDNNSEQACMQATLHMLVFDDISVKLRVYLQGALMENGGAISEEGLPLMRDDLRVSPYTGLNYIPKMDPYTISADPYAGTPAKFNKIGPGLLAENIEITDSLGVFGVNGDDAIVDWVHVELRSKDDMSIPIATRSGLVQRDGDVVDLDGISDLRFNAMNVDSFYVVVKHRSHLGVMSQKVAYSDMVDFTSPSFPTYDFGVQGLADYTGLSQNDMVINGYLALWAGDFDSNGKIKFTNPGDDQNVLFIDVLFTSPEFLINFDKAYGYFTGDFNMNSKTKYTNPSDDINYLFSQVLLYPLNSSYLSNYNSLIEQIPEE